MAILKGQNGVVYVGSTAVANVTSFSISEEADMLETTSLATSTAGAQGRTYIPGLRQITGSLDCNLDPGNAQHMSFEVGDTVAIKLEFTSGGVSAGYISGNVIITSSSMEVTPDAIITASFDFQTNDASGYTKTILGNLDETD